MNPLQKASARRKAIYAGVILGLFTLSMFWRGTIPIPLSGSASAGEPSAIHRLADRLAARTILSQARALELRELDEGEQELAGSTLRLALTGSRGLVVTYLWNAAIQKQKRNDFHEMEFLVRQVTKLQPHFITPWIFQSWNIAYNVSVEMQGSGDMYFYIARGIELLAEGERRQGRLDPENPARKIGSPDMRYQIAFYYQNKFGVSDNVEVLRCMFQLSCIPKTDRNPDDLIDRETGGVNLRKFREFCEKYPHLVRRLRGEDRAALVGGDEMTRKRVQEALKCPRPEDIVNFLRVNYDVPTRYKVGNELADPDKQFPVLPPRFNEGPEEAHPGIETKDDFSAYKAARAWYTYSCVPLPPNPLDINDKPLPAYAPRPGEYDPIRYRIPRSPMLIIFRQGAPRSQTAQAEMEQKEGWFDASGWRIGDVRDDSGRLWFPADPSSPNSRPLDLVIGTERPWSLEEWRKAYDMWRDHGERYGLIVEPARLKMYEEIARNRPTNIPPDPTPEQLEDPELRKWYLMSIAVPIYHQNRTLTNFPVFLAVAETERKPETVAARKTLYQAEQARKLSIKRGPDGAIALYEKGLAMWKEVLRNNRDFHRPVNSDRTDEETYTYELAYLRLLVQDDEKLRGQANGIVAALTETTRPLPFPFSSLGMPLAARDGVEQLKWHLAETVFSPFSGPMDVDDDRKGGPWVKPEIKQSVRIQQGIEKAPVVTNPSSDPVNPDAVREPTSRQEQP